MLSLKHYRNLITHCRPITILAEDSAGGSRIGGNPPEGITPPFVRSNTLYFATVELGDEQAHELSVFVGVDWEENSSNSLYKNVSKLKSMECPLVQCVVHSSAKRSNSRYLASELSGHALRIESAKPDIVVEPGGELLLPSKLGGQPYYFYFDTGYIANVKQLFEQGFIYLLQFTYPGPRLAPAGAWPFDEYTFHLFAKETSTGMDWRYGWG